MTHEQVVAIIVQLYPGSHWVLSGNTYDGFQWLDDPSTKPTAQQLGL